MGKKQEVITRVFDICSKKGILEFDNNLVKKISKEVGFGNPFDATKFDNSALLPELLQQRDYFVIHLGEGKHQFVKGISIGYHKFEPIQQDEVLQWTYRRSLLNEYDTSESNILSVVSNQRIIHDFLYEDIVASPKVYGSRRTKSSFSYMIGNMKVDASNVQMEIDLTLEYNRIVTIVEGKNGFPTDFAVYQLFHPFVYFNQIKETNRLPIEDITCCYVLRKSFPKNSIVRLYNFSFDIDPKLSLPKMDSIRLLKKAEYQLTYR